MVKWYNMSLPTISREFDSLWPHQKWPNLITLGILYIKQTLFGQKQSGGLFLRIEGLVRYFKVW